MSRQIFVHCCSIFRRLRPAHVLAVAVFFFLLSPDVTLAGETMKESVDKIFASATPMIALILSWATIGIVMFSTFFAVMTGDFMDTTYILDSGMGDTLHLVWTVFRNFVNIGFIVVLLVIAVMVILGIGGDGGGVGLLKKVLGKFVIALIAVNFTFFGARVVLTVSDVLATAVFSLPRAVPMMPQEVKTFCGDVEDMDACRQMVIEDLSGLFSDKNPTSDNTAKTITQKAKEMVKTWHERSESGSGAETLQKGFGKKNATFAIMTQLNSMADVLSVRSEGDGSGDLFINSIFSFVAAIMVAIVIFALFVGMLLRVVMLWVTIVVSPLLALSYVLKDLFDGASFGDFDPLKEFTKHAFLPVLVAVPLSIGFIMIMSGSALTLRADGLLSMNEGGKALNNILWWIAGLAVIWVGTFKMLKTSEVIGQWTDKIQNAGNASAKWAGGMLKYAPIVPLQGLGIDANGDGKHDEKDGSLSIAGALRQPSIALESMKQKSSKAAYGMARDRGYGTVDGVAKSNLAAALKTKDRSKIQTSMKEEDNKKLLTKNENGDLRKLFAESVDVKLSKNDWATFIQEMEKANTGLVKEATGLSTAEFVEEMRKLRLSDTAESTGFTAASSAGKTIDASKAKNSEKIASLEGEIYKVKDVDDKEYFATRSSDGKSYTTKISVEESNSISESIDRKMRYLNDSSSEKEFKESLETLKSDFAKLSDVRTDAEKKALIEKIQTLDKTDGQEEITKTELEALKKALKYEK